MAQNQYRCQACGETFNSEADLEQHNRKVHPQFRCEVCGQTLTSENELEAHNRSMHPETRRTPIR